MIDKEKAIELRKQGHTYKFISKIIGCSESWCKKELGDVPRGAIPPDDTKFKIISILEEALDKIRCL